MGAATYDAQQLAERLGVSTWLVYASRKGWLLSCASDQGRAPDRLFQDRRRQAP